MADEMLQTILQAEAQQEANRARRYGMALEAGRLSLQQREADEANKDRKLQRLQTTQSFVDKGILDPQVAVDSINNDPELLGMFGRKNGEKLSLLGTQRWGKFQEEIFEAKGKGQDIRMFEDQFNRFSSDMKNWDQSSITIARDVNDVLAVGRAREEAGVGPPQSEFLLPGGSPLDARRAALDRDKRAIDARAQQLRQDESLPVPQGEAQRASTEQLKANLQFDVQEWTQRDRDLAGEIQETTRRERKVADLTRLYRNPTFRKAADIAMAHGINPSLLAQSGREFAIVKMAENQQKLVADPDDAQAQKDFDLWQSIVNPEKSQEAVTAARYKNDVDTTKRQMALFKDGLEVYGQATQKMGEFEGRWKVLNDQLNAPTASPDEVASLQIQVAEQAALADVLAQHLDAVAGPVRKSIDDGLASMAENRKALTQQLNRAPAARQQEFRDRLDRLSEQERGLKAMQYRLGEGSPWAVTMKKLKTQRLEVEAEQETDPEKKKVLENLVDNNRTQLKRLQEGRSDSDPDTQHTIVQVGRSLSALQSVIPSLLGKFSGADQKHQELVAENRAIELAVEGMRTVGSPEKASVEKVVVSAARAAQAETGIPVDTKKILEFMQKSMASGEEQATQFAQEFILNQLAKSGNTAQTSLEFERMKRDGVKAAKERFPGAAINIQELDKLRSSEFAQASHDQVVARAQQKLAASGNLADAPKIAEEFDVKVTDITSALKDPNRPSTEVNINQKQSVQEAGKLAGVNQAIEELQQVRHTFINPDGTVNRAQILAGAFSLPFTKGRGAEEFIEKSVEIKLRAATGAAARPDELKLYKRLFGPSALDSDEIVIYKLDSFENWLQTVASTVDPAGQLRARAETLLNRGSIQILSTPEFTELRRKFPTASQADIVEFIQKRRKAEP